MQKQRKTPKNNYCIATEQKRMVNNKYKTYLSEARLTTLIRNIFREEFENNKKKLLKGALSNLRQVLATESHFVLTFWSYRKNGLIRNKRYTKALIHEGCGLVGVVGKNIKN